MTDIPPINEWAKEREQARFEEHQRLVRELQAARNAAAAAQKELEDIKKKLALHEALEATRANPPAWLTRARSAKENVAIPCLLVTDIHWGEVVNPVEVDYVNCYNTAIATARIRRAFEKAIHVTRHYWAGLRYEGFQLFLGGDIISGTIHEELRDTNEATIVESVLGVVEPLIAGIRLLCEAFERVHVAAVVGNHGRTSHRPRSKRRAQDNIDWLVYKLLARELSGTRGLTIQISDAADAHVTVHQTRYLLTHGDQFRGGSGISAAVAPLLLGAHRKTRRQAVAGRPYDIMVMGHWHQTIFWPAKGLIVGGAIKGYDEYAYLRNLEAELPQCAMWANTPQYGVTFHAPVFVMDRQEEGW